MGKKIKIYFIWHWQKMSTSALKGAFAVFDSLIYAISELTKQKDYEVRIIAISDYQLDNTSFFDRAQNINYLFFRKRESIIKKLENDPPDVLFLNHHSHPYELLLKTIRKLPSKKMIYYSSPIKLGFSRKTFITDDHKDINYHFVHHPYQKEQLNKKLKIDASRIVVAPKTADMEVFKPLNLKKKWDCIYPTRGKEGYWKRPELAIGAAVKNNFSLVMPGAKLKKRYKNVTTFPNWILPRDLAKLYNQSKCLIITSDDREMGPRVIIEAAACNLPIVCCSDSRACVSHVKNLGGFIAKPTVEDISEKIKLAVNTKVNYRKRLYELGYTYDLIYKKLLELL